MFIVKRIATRITAFGLILALAVWVGSAWNTQAVGETPGSIDDPVVTKSYVDQAIAQSGGGEASSSAALEIVTVPSGKTLVATEEGTEFIVRAGRAIAFSADKDGISDLTDGMDLTNGKSVANNHLIVSPRIGRGIAPDPAVEGNQIIVMVRGSHEVK
jgi:hypothetical protein